MANDANISPDKPVSFGRKCSWLAIATNQPDDVVKALKLRDVQVSGWQRGVAAAYRPSFTGALTRPTNSASGLCFVSAPVQQYVFVVSWNLPYPGDAEHPDIATPFLLNLAGQFSDVQYFATHRVSSYCLWARLTDGQFQRKFAWGDGEILWNDGALTPEERALNLLFDEAWETALTASAPVDESDDDNFDDASLDELPLIPGESDVLAMAGAWSIDPSTLEARNLPASTGFLGTLTL